jgi:hypothetical protein
MYRGCKWIYKAVVEAQYQAFSQAWHAVADLAVEVKVYRLIFRRKREINILQGT